MFTKSAKEVVEYLEIRAREFAQGCDKVYVSLSGGVDSAVVVTIISRAFGPENVVAMYRDIRSNPAHERDVVDLQKALGFKLPKIDANPMYDMFLEQCKKQFAELGIDWVDEGTVQAKEKGFDSAYASAKSRFATPLAGFIAKAVDSGRGRIFGTGNMEEDVLLRYYDKFGDGAVDNNILVGLTKMEVRQIALWFGEVYRAEIFARIAHKTPSADLQANGDNHNDENELTAWARNMGYDIKLSYGDCEREGNIAWVCKEELDNGIISGYYSFLEEMRVNAKQYYQDGVFDMDEEMLIQRGYDKQQRELIFFVRNIEYNTRHKELDIPGVTRWELREAKLVD